MKNRYKLTTHFGLLLIFYNINIYYGLIYFYIFFYKVFLNKKVYNIFIFKDIHHINYLVMNLFFIYL